MIGKCNHHWQGGFCAQASKLENRDDLYIQDGKVINHHIIIGKSINSKCYRYKRLRMQL